MTLKQELTLQLLRPCVWTRSISLRLDLRIKDSKPLTLSYTSYPRFQQSPPRLSVNHFKLSHENKQKRLIPAPHVDVEQDVLPHPPCWSGLMRAAAAAR